MQPRQRAEGGSPGAPQGPEAADSYKPSRPVPPDVAAVLKGTPVVLAGVAATERGPNGHKRECATSIQIISGLCAYNAQDLLSLVAAVRASPLQPDHMIQVVIDPSSVLGWYVITLAGQQDCIPRPVVLGVSASLPSFSGANSLRDFMRALDGDAKALAALTDFSSAPLLAFNIPKTLGALERLELRAVGLRWAPRCSVPLGLARDAARMHAYCPFRHAARKGSESRGKHSGMVSGGFRLACSGRVPGQLTEYTNKRATQEQVAAFYTAARAVGGALLRAARASVGAPLLSLLTWTAASRDPVLAALVLGPELPFQQIHSTLAAPGVEAHVDARDMGCIIGWAEVAGGDVAAAQREAAAGRWLEGRGGEGDGTGVGQQQPGEQESTQPREANERKAGEAEPLAHFAVYQYGLRVDVHHGSLLYLRSDDVLHGTPPIMLPDGRPSGRGAWRAGGGAAGGADHQGGERQLVGVALVSKADVTRAAIDQICDGRAVTWEPLPQ